MSRDCKVRDREVHLTLLREHYGDTDCVLFPDNPDVYHWKFGEDGTGHYDMLEDLGVPTVIRRGSCVLYLGRAAHPVPPGHELFDYDLQTAQADEEHSDDGSDNGEHAPDEPNAVAPPAEQDLWVMKVDDVVAILRNGLWCTYVLGTTFVTRSYMEHVYSQNVLDRLANVLPRLHPRQHVKTDLWDVARGHNIVTDADLWSLAAGACILPPPVGAITSFRVWVYPGCILYLAEDTRIEKKRGVVFVGDDPHSRCVCVHCAQEYVPQSDVMAYCSACSDAPGRPIAWCHEGCAELAPTPARLRNLCAVLNIGQQEEDVEAPAIRRAPSQGPSVWLPAPRGIRIRVDCPVRSWERISLAFRRAAQEQGSYDSQEEFLDVVRPLAAHANQGRFQREMPEAEVQRALELDTDDEDAFRLLRCPTCRAVM